MNAAMRVRRLPESQPVGGGDEAKSLRISGYPFSPFLSEHGEIVVWEPSSMGADIGAGYWRKPYPWESFGG